MKISQILFCSLCFLSCNNSFKHSEINYLIKDSCEISVKKLDRITASSGTNFEDSLLKLSLKFKLLSHENSQYEISKKLFSLNNSFEVKIDNVEYSPAFVQPIATGSSNDYAFYIAFEIPTLKNNTTSRDIVLKIYKTPFFKDSVLLNL